jgi:hypothetical protein
MGIKLVSYSLRKDQRFRVFYEQEVKIFGSKRNYVTGEWRKLHKAELHNLCSS